MLKPLGVSLAEVEAGDKKAAETNRAVRRRDAGLSFMLGRVRLTV